MSDPRAVRSCRGDGWARGLVAAVTRTPALIIVETRLPLIDGLTLCQLLRRNTSSRSVPIVAITADPGQVEHAYAVGADSVLVKPFLLDALLQDVQRLRERCGELCQIPVSAGRTVAAPPTNAGNKAHRRFDTTMPPANPPALRCPSCDLEMKYQHSQVGGVSSRHPEQWDYFECPYCRNHLQYRQRTRKIRCFE